MKNKLCILIALAALVVTPISAEHDKRWEHREVLAKNKSKRAKEKTAKQAAAQAQASLPCTPCCSGAPVGVKQTVTVLPSSKVSTCQMSKQSKKKAAPFLPKKTLQQSLTSCLTLAGINICTTTIATNNDTASQNSEPAMDVGPTQVIVAMKQRIRSLDKITMAPDNVLDVDLNRFFDQGAFSLGSSDPIIIFDNDSKQWFIFGLSLGGGRLSTMTLAVSNCADGTITADTVWTYYVLTSEDVTSSGTNTRALDYQKLAVDKVAVYMCEDTFDDDDFNFFDAAIVVANKAEVLAGGPITITTFNGLNTGAFDFFGPGGTQCVMNYDTTNTSPFGWLISPDFSGFGTLQPLPLLYLFQVKNPSTAPVLCRWDLDIPPYYDNSFSTVDRIQIKGGLKGLTNGFNVFSAVCHIRNGILWGITEVPVDVNGNSNPADPFTLDRIALRWYAIDIANGGINNPSPVLIDYGTIFDPAAVDPVNYWYSQMITNINGDVLIGSSSGGKADFWNMTLWTYSVNPNPVVKGSGNKLILQTGPTVVTNGVAWNPTQDFLGDNKVYRNGDYHRATIDPSDNVTMWTTGEFGFDPINWGVPLSRVTFDPPMASPKASAPKSAK